MPSKPSPKKKPAAEKSAPAMTFTPAAASPPTTPSPTPAPVMTDSVQYAGFWLRLVASIIDGIMLTAFSSAISMAMVSVGAQVFMEEMQTLGRGLDFMVALVYFVGMESSSKQATLGKMALGLKVTDLNGNRLTPFRSLGRWFAKFLSMFTLGIGYLMAAFTAKKQALHDLVAGTLVVKK